MSDSRSEFVPSFRCFRSFPCIPSLVLIVLFLALILNTIGGHAPPGTESVSNKKHVILLHGLTRSSRSLKKLERFLTDSGYCVHNLEYPSTKFSIQQLADEMVHHAVLKVESMPVDTLHFVTHSLGSIVIRYYLKNHHLPHLGRVVMLCPPNRGSQFASIFKNNFLFKTITGPSGQQLGTEAGSIPNELGSVDFDLGILAGNRSDYPLNSIFLPGPDDGIVSVENTKIAGMTDMRVLPYGHASILLHEFDRFLVSHVSMGYDVNSPHDAVLYTIRRIDVSHNLPSITVG